MKKLIFIIFGVISLTFLTNCRTMKKTTNTETKTEKNDSTSFKKETVSNTETNKAINDEVTTKVPKSNTGDVDFDKRVNDKIDEILSKLNTQKSSGSNSYNFNYDRLKRELRAEFEIGETKSQETDSKEESASVSETKEESTTEVETVIKRIPWWGWVIAVLLFQKQIAGVASTLFPGLAATSLYKRIML